LIKPNYLLKKPVGYYLRMRVPADMRGAYPGAVIAYSLDTKDYKEAT